MTDYAGDQPIPDDQPLCYGCGYEIDPDTCHCGDSINSHNIGSGHSPVPMGCVCGYVTPPDERLT